MRLADLVHEMGDRERTRLYEFYSPMEWKVFSDGLYLSAWELHRRSRQGELKATRALCVGGMAHGHLVPTDRAIAVFMETPKLPLTPGELYDTVSYEFREHYYRRQDITGFSVTPFPIYIEDELFESLDVTSVLEFHRSAGEAAWFRG